MLRLTASALIILFSFTSPLFAQQIPNIDPHGLVLTWQQDPTTTMTIDWHTDGNVTNATVSYRPVGETEWQTKTGKTFPYPYSDRMIQRVELTGLQSDTAYEFRTGDFSRIRKFRTMPGHALHPVRFAVGGDVRHRMDWMDSMNRHMATYSPSFVVWGGDLAYGNGLAERLDRWYEFMNSTMHTLVTPDGYTIPVIAGIGNHEVKGSYYQNISHESRAGIPPYQQNDASRAAIAPYFFNLFAFPGQPGYNVLDFGNYLSIIILDTDHTNPVEGDQTAWLDKILSARTHIPHIIPNYHVPAYPSVRNPEGATSKRVREHWVPLFEQHHVKLVFENHDHAYKRTFPIRNNAIHPSGVVYMGDGSWGVNAREIGRDHTEHAWYLKRAATLRHAIIVTVHGNQQHALVVGEDGTLIDEYPRTPHFDAQTTELIDVWDVRQD